MGFVGNLVLYICSSGRILEIYQELTKLSP